MRIPISWLRDFVDLEGLEIEDIASKLTLAGLEVNQILYAGLAMPTRRHGEPHEFKTSGISWDRDKVVVAEVREVMPHPNADRLTLLDLFDGQQQHTVLTGAPNLFHLKGKGNLSPTLKVAFAKEGATLYDGHADGWKLMSLKRTIIRGVESYSMVCSEKELGISEDHDGVILLAPDAPVGMPLANWMGDAVLEIDILPNMARNASVIGVARELAALTGRRLHQPMIKYKTSGAPVKNEVSVEISEPEMNPRFVLGLVRGAQIGTSPYEIQRRLKLAGMRPINCIVDATNYAMLELGQPLHAFDYGALKKRAGAQSIKMITRRAKSGESLQTLDGMERALTSMNVLVCDQNGPLSIAGVMGGVESEVTETTQDILLEGAAWNFINIRRTAKQHGLASEASFRFSRGVHPSLAQAGVQLGMFYMAKWSGGLIAPGLVDKYPLKAKRVTVTLSAADVRRLLGIDLTPKKIIQLLEALEFNCRILKEPAVRGRKARKNTRPSSKTDVRIAVTAPPNRLDIGEGVIGLADILEEIARLVGYDRIPSTTIADSLPPQVGNATHEWEENLRDLLTSLGFDEVVSYRLTSPEREARLGSAGDPLRIANPVAPERSILRRSLLASVLDDLERNVRSSDSFAFFEIGPIFESRVKEVPAEPRKLALAMTGLRHLAAWDGRESPNFDFFDLKGRIELLLASLHYTEISFTPAISVTYLHPGKAAEIRIDGQPAGVFGELHPVAKARYEFGQPAVLVAELDLDVLRSMNPRYRVIPVPEFPPVIEDIAVVVEDSVPAAQIELLIREAGGQMLVNVQLFDIYRGNQIDTGNKSLAYRLTYQSPEKTMTDAEAKSIRTRIVQKLESEVGARLRG